MSGYGGTGRVGPQQRGHRARLHGQLPGKPGTTQQHADGAHHSCRGDSEHGVLLQRMKGNTHPWRGTVGFPVRDAPAEDGEAAQRQHRAVCQQHKAPTSGRAGPKSGLYKAGNDCDASKLDFRRPGSSVKAEQTRCPRVAFSVCQFAGAGASRGTHGCKVATRKCLELRANARGCWCRPKSEPLEADLPTMNHLILRVDRAAQRHSAALGGSVT